MRQRLWSSSEGGPNHSGIIALGSWSPWIVHMAAAGENTNSVVDLPGLYSSDELKLVPIEISAHIRNPSFASSTNA